jgi:N6-adenosine-specific RNA methylase IME4
MKIVKHTRKRRGKVILPVSYPEQKYSIVYADPPWFYSARPNGKGKAFGAGAQGHYPVMRIEDICSLPVADITDRNCMLFPWCTFPHLEHGLQVITSWGFKYTTQAFTWIKTYKKCGKPCFGVGYYTKSNAEVCLLATKGKPIKVSDSVSSVIISPREQHSKKPDEARDRIVQFCGDIRRIELFARESVEGWDCWGNEVESNVELIAPAARKGVAA